jgi:5'-deoxynucleotidase YfbR-like HD superfamily hydrolase
MQARETYKLAILMRNAGAVKRYHATRTLRQQTNAEHSGGVAGLVLCVCPNPSAALLTAAIMHDVPELKTGDLPATIKWENPQLNAMIGDIEAKFIEEYQLPQGMLNDDEVKLLKFCDYAELVFWCLEEVGLGNGFIWPIVHRGIDALKALGPINEFTDNVLNYLVHASSGDLDDMVINDGK